MYKSFLQSEFPENNPENAFFYVIPCPMEKTVSYGKGTKAGPNAIIEASLELEALENGRSPGKLGIYTMPPVDCTGSIENDLNNIEKAVKTALLAGAIPVLLGGEHTITLGALRALKKEYDKKNKTFGVVQFDAHADLRQQYQGSEISHATVMRRAVQDLNLPLVQFAARDISEEETKIRKVYGITHYDAYFLGRVGLPEQPLPPDFPEDIYISFDLDAFDSSLMPATGTPSPGGINFREAHFILEKCINGHNVIGMDVAELAPVPFLHHADFTAAKLVHLLMALTMPKEEEK